VHARAAWRAGRWTVVFQRPLLVPTEQGLSFVPAEPYAAAFAIWDGACRDRASQKVVSIWNDLQLE
jgi:DMSO reductase family type II enzyme heme b subunit